MAGVTGSRATRVVTFPLLGIVLVTGLPFAIWFTSWYAASLEHTWAFALAHLALLLVGFAFFWPLLAPDVDRRLPWAAAVAVVFVESVLDAVPGIVLWLRSTLLAPEYWLTLNRPWDVPRWRTNSWAGWSIGGSARSSACRSCWSPSSDGSRGPLDAARIDAEAHAQEAAKALRRTGGA